VTLWLWWLGIAQAGSGPWIVGEGATSLYFGGESEQFHTLRYDAGDDGTLEVGEGITKFGLKAIATVGLGPRIDLQFVLPWYNVQAKRPDAELCTVLGLSACATTRGIGLLEARGKGLLLDEFFGAPVSVATGFELRIGQFTLPTRERLTNLGVGTTDVGVFASIGRSGGLGNGTWSAYLEGIGRYRVPTTQHYPHNTGTRAVPGSEVEASTQILVGPSPRFSIGPVVYALYRPEGREFEALDLTDPDRFAALRIGNVRVGGVAVVRSQGDVSASISVLRTVYAYNNPNDNFLVSIGMQVDTRFRRTLDD
jgi:hypothetical protein